MNYGQEIFIGLVNEVFHKTYLPIQMPKCVDVPGVKAEVIKIETAVSGTLRLLELVDRMATMSLLC